jgi:hypothetical protein
MVGMIVAQAVGYYVIGAKLPNGLHHAFPCADIGGEVGIIVVKYYIRINT